MLKNLSTSWRDWRDSGVFFVTPSGIWVHAQLFNSKVRTGLESVFPIKLTHIKYINPKWFPSGYEILIDFPKHGSNDPIMPWKDVKSIFNGRILTFQPHHQRVQQLGLTWGTNALRNLTLYWSLGSHRRADAWNVADKIRRKWCDQAKQMC